MEKITIFDNLAQAVDIANKEGKLGIQDSITLYQTMLELSKALEIEDTLKERAEAEQAKAEAESKVTKKTIKKV